MDLGSFREREQIDTQRENEEEEEIFKNEFKSENGPNDCVDCSGVVHDSDRCIVDDEESYEANDHLAFEHDVGEFSDFVFFGLCLCGVRDGVEITENE